MIMRNVTKQKRGKITFAIYIIRYRREVTNRSPSPALLKGRELLFAVFKVFRRFFSLLGKAGMELVVGKMPVVRRWGSWFMVDMSASSNSVGVALSRRRYFSCVFPQSLNIPSQ